MSTTPLNSGGPMLSVTAAASVNPPLRTAAATMTTAGAPPVVRAAGRPGSPLPVVPAAPNTSPSVGAGAASAAGETNVVLESRRTPLGGGQRLLQDHTPGRGRQAPAGPPPDQAAWVRANAWTQGMRKTHSERPGNDSFCACQYGTTTQCRDGHHDQCRRTTPLRFPEAYVCGRGGERVLSFAEPYAHPAESATGMNESAHAMVWLADRTCQWLCDCGCGHADKPVIDQDAGDDGTSRPIVQLNLFEVV